MPPMSKNIGFVLILVYLIVAIVGFVSMLKHNFNTLSKNKELQNKILETQLQLKEQELTYLKKQIHPHFLFNTLNTIYGFSIKQSNQTPRVILMLSNLLDYILYQIEKPRVSLKEEVSHIKEYIELEKLRFQDTLKVQLISNKINESIQIAPMILIPFVENAFKHGSIINGYLSVDIEIEATDNQLRYAVKNTFLNNDRNEQQEAGIGLENLKKRLDMNYTGTYKLDISTHSNWFCAELSITNLTMKR